MADGGVTIELDADLGARLKDAAAAAGRSPEEMAASLIQHGLDDDWAETRARLAEYAHTGEAIDAHEAMAELRARLAERLSQNP